MMLPSYQNPFADRERVIDLAQCYLKGDAKSQYPDSAALFAGQGIRDGSNNLRENFQTIFRWKLQSFLKLKPQFAEFPKGILDSKIEGARAAIIDANTGQSGTIIKALQVLDALPSVGIPVASAFLTAVYPKRFTVIDRQAYKALSVAFPNSLSTDEYLHYLKFCQKQADCLGVTLRCYDRALWQLGKSLKTLSKKPSTKLAKRPGGIISVIKTLAWQHPEWNSEKFMEVLENDGLSPKRSTVDTVLSDFRHTLRLLRSLGVISDN